MCQGTTLVLTFVSWCQFNLLGCRGTSCLFVGNFLWGRLISQPALFLRREPVPFSLSPQEFLCLILLFLSSFAILSSSLSNGVWSASPFSLFLSFFLPFSHPSFCVLMVCFQADYFRILSFFHLPFHAACSQK